MALKIREIQDWRILERRDHLFIIIIVVLVVVILR